MSQSEIARSSNRDAEPLTTAYFTSQLTGDVTGNMAGSDPPLPLDDRRCRAAHHFKNPHRSLSDERVLLLSLTGYREKTLHNKLQRYKQSGE
jgi:hypothetical protein